MTILLIIHHNHFNIDSLDFLQKAIRSKLNTVNIINYFKWFRLHLLFQLENHHYAIDFQILNYNKNTSHKVLKIINNKLLIISA